MAISRWGAGFFSSGASYLSETIGLVACSLGDFTSFVLTLAKKQKYEYELACAISPAACFLLAIIITPRMSSYIRGDLRVGEAAFSFLNTVGFSMLRLGFDLTLAHFRNYEELNSEGINDEDKIEFIEDGVELLYEALSLFLLLFGKNRIVAWLERVCSVGKVESLDEDEVSVSHQALRG